MSQDFSELIGYLDGRFVGIDKQLEEMKKDFTDLRSSVDTYAKKADTSFGEMVVLSHEVDRHERWFQQIAKKIDIKLEY